MTFCDLCGSNKYTAKLHLDFKLFDDDNLVKGTSYCQDICNKCKSKIEDMCTGNNNTPFLHSVLSIGLALKQNLTRKHLVESVSGSIPTDSDLYKQQRDK